MTVAMLATALSGTAPAAYLLAARTAAAGIVTVVNTTIALDTNILYYRETVTGLKGTPYTDYKVVQKWYSDNAHTKYLYTTTYYASFY